MSGHLGTDTIIHSGYRTTFNQEDQQDTVKLLFNVVRGPLIKIYALIIVIAICSYSLYASTPSFKVTSLRDHQFGAPDLDDTICTFPISSER
jgi:hypothetical protein